jgi:hypothetical protein
MPQGYVTLAGRSRASQLAAFVRWRQRRSEAASGPEYVGADVAPRPTVRMEVFDFGGEPLPGYSWPPPRRTGWER